MGPFSLSILMMNLLQMCYGHTYLFYDTDDNADGVDTFSCKDFVQKIDFDSQLDCAREREETPPDLFPLDASGSGDSEECCVECEDGMLQIEARSGFYARVRDCSPHVIYPFHPGANVVDIYIVAVKDARSVHEHGQPTQTVTEESAILLNCSFTRDTGTDQPYVLYWLKMSVNGSASCISSYSTENQQHCFIDPDIGSRTSNSSSSSSGIGGSSQLQFHNVSIGQSQPSDSGVYVCVLNEQKRAPPVPSEQKTQRASWTVIRNITVTVMTHHAPNPNSNQGSLVGLHVATAFFLITLLAFILLLARRKIKSSQARQVMQRSSNEGNNDPYCSPYAAGFRQAEPYSVVNIKKQMDSARPMPVGPSGCPPHVPEQNSVVQLRTQEDSVLSTSAGPSGLSSDAPETYSVISFKNVQQNSRNCQ